MAPTNDGSKLKFEMVETSPQIGAGNRNTEGGTVYPSGRLPINAEASDIWRILVNAAGLPIDNHLSKFGVHKASKTIAVYPVPHGTPNCAPVRINPHTGGTDTFTFYLGGVFKEHHRLRPTSKRDIIVTPDTDEDGRPILMISLASALTTRTKSRTPGTPTAKKEAPGTKKQAPGTKKQAPDAKDEAPDDNEDNAEEQIAAGQQQP